MTYPAPAPDLSAARAFVAENLPKLTAELLTRDKNAPLPDGPLHDLALLCQQASTEPPVQLAVELVHEAALRRVVADPAVARTPLQPGFAVLPLEALPVMVAAANELVRSQFRELGLGDASVLDASKAATGYYRVMTAAFLRAVTGAEASSAPLESQTTLPVCPSDIELRVTQAFNEGRQFEFERQAARRGTGKLSLEDDQRARLIADVAQAYADAWQLYVQHSDDDADKPTRQKASELKLAQQKAWERLQATIQSCLAGVPWGPNDVPEGYEPAQWLVRVLEGIAKGDAQNPRKAAAQALRDAGWWRKECADRMLAQAAQAEVPELPASVKEALEFYAGDLEFSVSFDPHQRALNLMYLRNHSDDWEAAGEDRRGHDLYRVTNNKAQAALTDLLTWLEACQAARPPAATKPQADESSA